MGSVKVRAASGHTRRKSARQEAERANRSGQSSSKKERSFSRSRAWLPGIISRKPNRSAEIVRQLGGIVETENATRVSWLHQAIIVAEIFPA